MTDSITISFSQIASFLRCSYFWDLSYRRRIARYTVHVPFEKGSAIHVGVAAAWRLLAGHQRAKRKFKTLVPYRNCAVQAINRWHKKWMSEHGKFMNDQEIGTMEQLVDDAKGVAKMVIDSIDFMSWRVLWYKGKPLIERELMIPLRGWKGFRTFPDLVAEDLEYGGNWVVDWKSRSAFLDDSAEEVNLQFATMQFVLGRLKISTSGSIDFQVKSTPPADPKKNKDGSMSRARVATTWEVYRKALVKAKLNPKDYAEMEVKLDVPMTKLNRHYRGAKELNAIWREIVRPAADQMCNSPAVIRSMGFMNCNGCWARQFCLGELRDEDTNFMLKTTYVDKDHPLKRVKIDPEEMGVS